MSHHHSCVPFYSEVCPGRRTALDPVVPGIFRLAWSGQEEPSRRGDENIWVLPPPVPALGCFECSHQCVPCYALSSSDHPLSLISSRSMVTRALLLSSLRYCAMSNVLAMLNSHFVLWHFQRTKANTPPHTVLRSLLYNTCVSFSNNANIYIIYVEAIYFGKICQAERQIQTSIR